jgi:hypothetical protein
MVHIDSSLRRFTQLAAQPAKVALPAKAAQSGAISAPAIPDFRALFSGVATPTTAESDQTTAAQPAQAAQTQTADATTAQAIADFRALFGGGGVTTPATAGASVTTPATAEPAQTTAAPTAESVFGANPWVTNPTGQGPSGTYSFNPLYFATPQTAAKVAQMVGGTVVENSELAGAGGFAQQQPNLMVKLPDGRLVNAGLIASFYTHGYPQSYIDRLIANEVNTTT